MPGNNENPNPIFPPTFHHHHHHHHHSSLFITHLQLCIILFSPPLSLCLYSFEVRQLFSLFRFPHLPTGRCTLFPSLTLNDCYYSRPPFPNSSRQTNPKLSFSPHPTRKLSSHSVSFPLSLSLPISPGDHFSDELVSMISCSPLLHIHLHFALSLPLFLFFVIFILHLFLLTIQCWYALPPIN